MITIPEFYSNRDVFITGASGFLGKILIEKLLRSCSDVKRIFVLLREKRSKSIHERLEEIKNMALFGPLLEKNPRAFEKITAIEGDVGVLGLGISDESRELLKNVSIIFHSAASVRFDDMLREAIILNTRGTHEVIKFALTLKNLISFVHVSTTYSYPERHVVDEKIYPVNCDWRRIIELAEKVDGGLLECLFPHFSDFKPNSYVYTKAFAEHICESYKNQIPITIVRPSIVTGTEREPLGGWNDNYNGPVGLLVACGIGVMRTMYASRKALLDSVTVDIVAKTLIAAAWKTTMDSSDAMIKTTAVNENLNGTPLPIFNCASVHSMDLDLLVYQGQSMIREMPFEKCIFLPGGGVTLCRFMNFFRIVCFQLFPAVIVDQLLKLKGQKPILMKLQRTIQHASAALKFFVFSSWDFKTTNFVNLNKSLLPDDEHDFSMDRTVESDRDFYKIQMLGARRYLLKEPDSSIPIVRRRIIFMLIVHNAFHFLFYSYILYKLAEKINLLESMESAFFSHSNGTIIERF